MSRKICSFPKNLGSHRWFCLSAALCSILFANLITGGTYELIYPDSYGDFFDYQALALLDGRLDVPESAISGEALIVDGKYYGYFGITPSILRLPLLVFGGQVGVWSRMLMLLAYAISLTASYLLLREAMCWWHGKSVSPPALLVVLYTTGVGLGSTLLFLASRAYVYHEAIIWGVAFALLASVCALRYLRGEKQKVWSVLGVLCATLALHARPPAGLFGVSCVVLAALIHFSRCCRSTEQERRQSLTWHASIILSCVVFALSVFGVAYLKFKTWELMPLRYGVQYTPERIAWIEGRVLRESNIPFNVHAYLLDFNAHIEPQFPYLRVDRLKRSEFMPHFPAARLDTTEHTLAIPYSMPFLCACFLSGIAFVVQRRKQVVFPIVILLVAGIPQVVLSFCFIALSQRYTGDFVPLLISVSAFGFVGLSSIGAKKWQCILGFLSASLVFVSAVVTGLITLEYQGAEVWGVSSEMKDRYERTKQWFDTLPHLPNDSNS